MQEVYCSPAHGIEKHIELGRRIKFDRLLSSARSCTIAPASSSQITCNSPIAALGIEASDTQC